MNRTERCDDQYRQLFHGERGVHPTDPEFMDILQKFIFGEVAYSGALDNRQRELITVCVLAALQTLPQLKVHVVACLNAGAAPVEIREAIYGCAPLIGFPRTLNAIAVMNEIFKKKEIALPLQPQDATAEDDRLFRGREMQAALRDGETDWMPGELPGDPDGDLERFVTELRFCDFCTRGGLSIAMRELLTFCVLTALGRSELLGVQAKICRKAGSSPETMAAALIQCMPYVGIPSALDAVKVVRTL